MPVTAERVTYNINKWEVLKSIGYNSGSTAPARIVRLVNELTRDNLYIPDPSYTYMIRDVLDVSDDHIIIDGHIHLRSRQMATMLSSCCKVALFVLTIGDNLEKAAAKLAREGSVLKASVLEAIGSNAAESVATLLYDRIRYEVSNHGLYTGRRFSPGYCDWPVDQQEEIFKALNGNSAGVKLTEGSLMLPRKSISGIIGIGTYASNIIDFNPCIPCLKEECPGRRG